MMTELEKCMAGMEYDCHANVFIEAKAKATQWMQQYNTLPYEQRAKRYDMLKELFAEVGENCSVGDDFICGFGCNIHLGNNVSINYRCTLIDCNEIKIGNNVLIAPCVQINTASHPVSWKERRNPKRETNLCVVIKVLKSVNHTILSKIQHTFTRCYSINSIVDFPLRMLA